MNQILKYIFALFFSDSAGFKRSEGQKASFCLEDYDCEDGYKKTYNCTNKGDQGIQQIYFLSIRKILKSHLNAKAMSNELEV